MRSGFTPIQEQFIVRLIQSEMDKRFGPQDSDRGAERGNSRDAVQDATPNDSHGGQIISRQQETAMVQIAEKSVQRASKEVYKRVMNEINTKIVPKMAGTMEMLRYHMEDPGEVINNYRQAVGNQGENVRTLTNGDTRGIVSENVSVFFREDDEDIWTTGTSYLPSRSFADSVAYLASPNGAPSSATTSLRWATFFVYG